MQVYQRNFRTGAVCNIENFVQPDCAFLGHIDGSEVVSLFYESSRGRRETMNMKTHDAYVEASPVDIADRNVTMCKNGIMSCMIPPIL